MRSEMASLFTIETDESSTIDRIVRAFWTAPRDRNAIATIVSITSARPKSPTSTPR